MGKKLKLPEINFMARSRHTLFLSLFLLIISVFSLSTRGLNLGIDFTGGTLVELGFEGGAELESVRTKLGMSEFAGANVQKFGGNSEILIRLPPTRTADSSELSNRIVAIFPTAEMRRIEFVGPQVGQELTEGGLLALIYAFGGILVYVMLRFTLKFSVGAVVATIHDVIITMGFFSLTGFEFDLTVLAAVLAVIGYSLNDTIVVFDRIRENFRRLRKTSAIETINRSLNETLSRTLVTSGTTLIVVVSLLLLGGELISGFATALLVGVFVGTYSSIYVASNALVILGVNKIDLMPVKKDETPLDPRP